MRSLDNAAPDPVDRTVSFAADPARSSTAERLQSAAAALFRERGYASTSTRQLGDALGIRGASLYHHISSKEMLLYEICLTALRGITEDFIAVAPDDNVTMGRLRSLFVAHMNRAMRGRDLHATMLIEFRELSEDHRRVVLALRAEYEALWRKQLVAGQVKGIIRSDLDAKYLTLTLLNLLNWAIFWYDPSGPLSPAELAAIFFAVYIEGAEERPPGLT